ncbi:MAG TPA: S1 family peptidase [Pseudonocardiaceae bacterium]|nr:S1 family peptidase [Pseudonocardiaceae bacterium]
MTSRRRRTLTVAAVIVAASALGTAAAVVGFAPSASASSDGSFTAPAATADLVPAPNSGLLRYTLNQLTAVRQVFNALPPTPNTAWGIDPRSHQVVLTLAEQAPADGTQRLLATAQRYGDMVKVVRVPGAFSEQVLGGDQIRTSDIICSAGFNVTKGDQDYVITAGHCTQGLPNWRGLGPSVSSNFPTTDFGLIRNGSGDAPAAVDRYDGTEQPITSVGTATVGQAVCASGMATGVTCGQVTAIDQTVDYGDGDVVDGLIQTNVHTDHGDSGGPLFAGSVGLGTVSGGDGTTDFFQPLTVTLATLGVNLVEP